MNPRDEAWPERAYDIYTTHRPGEQRILVWSLLIWPDRTVELVSPDQKHTLMPRHRAAGCLRSWHASKLRGTCQIERTVL